MKYNDELKIINNRHYYADLEFALKYNQWLLYLSGSWPVSKKHPSLQRIFVRFANLVIVLVMIFLLLPLLLSSVILDQNKSENIKNLAFLIVGPGYIIKYIILVCNSDKFYECMQQIYADWYNIFSGSRKIMLKYARYNRNFLIVMTSSFLLTCVSWQSMAFLKKVTVIDSVTVHNLPFSGYYFLFDGQFEPYYFHVRLFQFFAHFVFMLSCCNTSIIAVTLMLHICGQYKVLSNNVSEFGNRNWEDISNAKIYLKRIVNKHYTLMR